MFRSLGLELNYKKTASTCAVDVICKSHQRLRGVISVRNCSNSSASSHKKGLFNVVLVRNRQTDRVRIGGRNTLHNSLKSTRKVEFLSAKKMGTSRGKAPRKCHVRINYPAHL